jgi:hypothetical protein
MNLLENLRNPNIVNGGSYNQPHVATLKVVVHVPIKRYGMLWGFQSLHMNDGWYPKGEGGGFLGLHTTLKFTNPKEKTY